jgi:AbrB family looped-hinge helix DNA binding protein
MNRVTKTYAVRLRDRGQVTIPKPIREQLPAAEGDILTLLQIDDLLILAPQELRIPALQARFRKEMEEADVSLADLLEGLAAEREAIYRERSGDRSEESA